MRTVLFLILTACGGGPEAQLEKARESLGKGAYDEAVAAASAGIAEGAAGAVAWRLELTGLEAEARGAKAPAVVARLERLAASKPDQVPASLFVQTAGQVKEAGDAIGAISVLDAGAKRFPADADLAKAIEQAKSGGSAAELDHLRSLGYLE
jgi:hypothetical protein